MSLAARVQARAAVERRSVATFGDSSIPGPMGDVASGSFASIDLRDMESSLQKIAIWSAVDLIAGVAGQLPLDTYRTDADGVAQPIGNGRLVDDPGGEGHGAGDWVYQYLSSKLLRGNAYGKLDSPDNRTGYPTQIVLYHPDDVTGWRDRNGVTQWRVNGVTVPAAEIWHRRSYPVAGCLLGMSPILKHATTIGAGIAAGRFGAQFFTDGAHPTSLLINSEEEIDGTKAREVKNRFVATVWGSREPIVLGRGWDHRPVSVTPEESQFLQTQQYTGAECCRIFGPGLAEILGYDTGTSMTYSNIEQRAIDLLKFVLNRWLRDVESVLTRYLPGGQYVRFNRKALLETDILTRYKAHNMAIAGHYMAPSEIRPIEDLPPLTPEQLAEIDKLAVPAPILRPPKESDT